MSQYKYFVGGFHPSTTNEQLGAAFQPYGTVLEAFCTRRNGVGRGFGFVTFAEPVDASAMVGISVNGSVVTVKDAVAEGQIDATGATEPFKYFIGGLPSHITSEQLQHAMSLYGSVKSAIVLSTQDGRSRGFGFVTFYSTPSNALVSGAASVLGQPVTVKESVPQHDLQSRKLFIGGLTPEMVEDQLYAMFSPYGIIIEAQVIRDPQTGTSRGFGFVTFQSPAERAVALQSFPGEYMGRQISIRAVENKSAREERPARFGAGYAAPMYPGSSSNLVQQLEAEKRRRAELERRLAAYEGGKGGYAAPTQAPWRPSFGRSAVGVRRYRPY